jgi:hypothetical protein
MHVTRNIYYFASIYFFLLPFLVCAAQQKQEEVPVSLLFSIERDLSNPFYVENILPYNLSYVQLLLNQGNLTDQDCAYAQSTLRLFSNLFKKTPCINAYSFGMLVEQLPDLLKKHVSLKKTDSLLQKSYLLDIEMYDRFQAAVNEMLFSSLSSRFHEFKKEPIIFLNSLSRTIMELAQEEIALEQLRTSLVRFLEIGISKLMWDPSDYTATWKHVKELSAALTRLMETKIIDDSADLDDIFWSLIQRYMFFIKINAPQIPLDFYEKIEQDLASNNLLLVSLDEQESFIETKKAYCMRILMDCKTRVVAYNHGILTP